MKRRNFLNTAATTAASLAVGRTLRAEDAVRTEPSKKIPMAAGNGILAGKTLEQLRDEYRYFLYDDYVPFHDRYVVDHQYGGFTLQTGWNGPTISFGKTARYTGRGIWTYSFLYNKLDANPRHLEAAAKAVAFIMRHKPTGENLWPDGYSREGKVLAPPSTRIYEDLFLANGFAEYSKIKGNESYWDLAKAILFKCLKIYDTPGYHPDAAQGYLGPEAPLLPGGARVLGHWFMLISLATGMLEGRSDPEIEAVAARCVEAITRHHYNPDFDLMNEVICHDFSRPENDLRQLVYTGHALETLWMVLYEAVRRKDKALFDLISRHFRRHLEVAWDDVYGGVLRNLRHVEKNIWDLDKTGWVQMEVLIGLVCIIEHTGALWAKEFFSKFYPWVIANFPLKRYGLPLWIDGADRRVTFDKGDGTRRAENFHHPRHLMLNLLAIERMIRRGGKVSGIFPS